MAQPSFTSAAAPRNPRANGWQIGQLGRTQIILARSWVLISVIAVVVYLPTATRSLSVVADLWRSRQRRGERSSLVAIIEAEMLRYQRDLVVLLDDLHQPYAYIQREALTQVLLHVSADAPSASISVSLPDHVPLTSNLRGSEFFAEVQARPDQFPVLTVVDSGRVIGLLWVCDVVNALK